MYLLISACCPIETMSETVMSNVRNMKYWQLSMDKYQKVYPQEVKGLSRLTV